VLTRRYGAYISADDQKVAAITFAFGEESWSRENKHTEMKTVFAALKHPYRLTYHFDENILVDNVVRGVREPVADVFAAATRNATTIFETSNSLFNNGGANGAAGDASLGMSFFGNSDVSLQSFLGKNLLFFSSAFCLKKG
jgi:hypothetical protein